MSNLLRYLSSKKQSKAWRAGSIDALLRWNLLEHQQKHNIFAVEIKDCAEEGEGDQPKLKN